MARQLRLSQSTTESYMVPQGSGKLAFSGMHGIMRHPTGKEVLHSRRARVEDSLFFSGGPYSPCLSPMSA